MAQKLGKDAKLMYKVGGQAAGGAWNELTNTRDVTLNLEKSEADVSTRGNNGWRAIVAALKDASVEFEMVWDTEDAGFQALMESFFQDGIIGLQVLDSADGVGVQADFMVTNFSRSEPLEEAITASVTMKPTYSANPPQLIGF